MMSRVDQIFLVPAGPNRFELYSEAPDEPLHAPAAHEGRLRHLAHVVLVKWHHLVDAARRGSAAGRLVRWRDHIVCRLAESIAEQRTLWSLRERTAATIRYPATIAEEQARRVLNATLDEARRHHLKWLIIDAVLCAITGPLLFFIPGPNVVGIYFLLRVIGHYLSWHGAKQAMESIAWRFEPDQNLAELAALVNVPRAARAPRVEAIAERLNLPRLSAFFDRVAVPSS
jgi:hypothetical protein